MVQDIKPMFSSLRKPITKINAQMPKLLPTEVWQWLEQTRTISDFHRLAPVHRGPFSALTG